MPACESSDIEQHADRRCFTYRAVAGVSMGGGASSKMGFTYPELFDVVGIMGTPFSETTFFWNMMINEFMGGFCDLETLEAVMAANPDNPDILNDPSTPGVFCGLHDITPEDGYTEAYQQVEPHQYPAVEESQCYLFRSGHNNWYRGPDAGRGGTFSRNGLIEITHDIVAAYGNRCITTREQLLPTGRQRDLLVHGAWNQQHNASLCDNPISENFYNKSIIQTVPTPSLLLRWRGGQDGFLQPGDEHNLVVDYLLAVDLNGNGKREYGEPVVAVIGSASPTRAPTDWPTPTSPAMTLKPTPTLPATIGTPPPTFAAPNATQRSTRVRPLKTLAWTAWQARAITAKTTAPLTFHPGSRKLPR